MLYEVITDYNIDMNDKNYAGSPNPKITGGLTNTFNYKNWSLSVFCNFVIGRKVWNGYISDKLNRITSYNVCYTKLLRFY